MLYQRRMRLPHVEDPTLNGVPLERMMLSLSSDGITIDNAEPTVSVQDMPGRDGRLDLTLTDPSGGPRTWATAPSRSACTRSAEKTTSSPPKPGSRPWPAQWSRSHGGDCPANTKAA